MTNREIWSELKWEIADIADHFYWISDEKAQEIAFTIGKYFDERMIELGFDVMDSLVQTFGLLDDEPSPEDEELDEEEENV